MLKLIGLPLDGPLAGGNLQRHVDFVSAVLEKHPLTASGGAF